MPENFAFTIRSMESHDLDRAISLSESEGWNQTPGDWKLLFENPNNACIVAVHNNEVIGTATALNHSGNVAWIGMVLVNKTFRGQGVGKALINNIINRLKNFDSIKLDATPAGQTLYQKLGFEDEFLIYRMINPSFTGKNKLTFNYQPESIDNKNLCEVLKNDRKIFGVERSYLLQNLFRNYPEKAFLLKRNRKLDGYVFGRNGKRYNYIGPVSASSDETARILICKALGSLTDQSVALDILYDKEEIIKWLESLGFVKQRHFVRMYLRGNPYCGLIKYQYLISGPEFG